jgi:hypothetical protein
MPRSSWVRLWASTKVLCNRNISHPKFDAVENRPWAVLNSIKFGMAGLAYPFDLADDDGAHDEVDDGQGEEYGIVEVIG